MAAEKQLLIWKSIKWETVGPGLAVGQYREEADAVGGSYIFYIFRGLESSLLLGNVQNTFFLFCENTPTS